MTRASPALTVFVPTAPGRWVSLRNCVARLGFQVLQNFEAIVISDGQMPELSKLRRRASFPLTIRQCGIRSRRWGHPQTEQAIRRMRGDWFVRVNDDNVVYPDFTSTIGEWGERTSAPVLIWKIYVANAGAHHGLVLPTRLPPVQSGIDMLNFAVRRDLAQGIGFPFRSHDADWEFLSECLERSGGKYEFIPRVLAEHW